MKKISLRLKGEKIIIIALLMIVAAEISKNIWPLAATDSESANAIQRFLAEKNSTKNILIDSVELHGYFLLTMSLITTGIRCLRNKWPNTKGIVLTIIGLGICLFHLAEIEAYKKIGKTFDDTHPYNYELIKSKIEHENLSPNLKAKLSEMYAKEKYLYEGKKVEYFSESGDSKVYGPTAEDLKFRNVTRNAKEIWDYNNRRLPTMFKWWVTIGLVSLAVGIFTPITKVSNTRLDHDRA